MFRLNENRQVGNKGFATQKMERWILVTHVVVGFMWPTQKKKCFSKFFCSNFVK